MGQKMLLKLLEKKVLKLTSKGSLGAHFSTNNEPTKNRQNYNGW